MQLHAEEAVTAHIANLQEEFSFNLKPKNAPFVNISDAETQRILKQAMKSSNRWAVMKDLDKATMKSLLHSAKKKQNDGLYLKGEKIP
jgi:penicillin-binding protein 1A